LALGAANILHFLPKSIRRLCHMKAASGDEHTADWFLSARNSAGAFAIGMSFFASGMGAWVVCKYMSLMEIVSCIYRCNPGLY
jgi:hypothetical protein